MADTPQEKKSGSRDKISEDILNQMPQRERLVNIWKAEIEFYERLRRENGAAVIGIRLVEGPKHHYDEITDFLIDSIRANDLFTKFNASTALVDCWGNDINQLNKICARIRNSIPVDATGAHCFELRFSMVVGIPFLELHFPDTLEIVLHRVLSLLSQAEAEEKPMDYVPYDHFLDMEKKPEIEARMKDYTITRPKTERKKSRTAWDEFDARKPKLF